MSAAGATAAAPAPRLRSVALPAEHGGWGLTLEPGLLGLLVAPSAAGACLALAALVAFVLRTPLKLVLVDRRRGRSLPRTRLAGRVALAEGALLAVLVVGAFALAEASFWVPIVVAAPLVVVESWFDVRSRSRRLLPELAGAIGICAVAAMIVLADGGDGRLAAAVWVVLAARVATSIPQVRAMVGRLHGRDPDPTLLAAGDAAALAFALGAVLLDRSLVAGALAVVALVGIQRATARPPLPRAVVLGIRQMVLGLAVVLVTGIGVLATG